MDLAANDMDADIESLEQKFLTICPCGRPSYDGMKRMKALHETKTTSGGRMMQLSGVHCMAVCKDD